MKQQTAESRITYVRRLRDLGIEQLGHGYYSHVFQHPQLPDIAIKVVDSEDFMYLRWARWSKLHPGNAFMPVIESIIQYQDYALVFMEKLERIHDMEYDTFLADIGWPGGFNSTNIESARDDVHSDDLRLVLYFLARYKGFLDLHPNNFMQRGHQIVFSDPLATSCTSSNSRK